MFLDFGIIAITKIWLWLSKQWTKMVHKRVMETYSFTATSLNIFMYWYIVQFPIFITDRAILFLIEFTFNVCFFSISNLSLSLSLSFPRSLSLSLFYCTGLFFINIFLWLFFHRFQLSWLELFRMQHFFSMSSFSLPFSDACTFSTLFYVLWCVILSPFLDSIVFFPTPFDLDHLPLYLYIALLRYHIPRAYLSLQ